MGSISASSPAPLCFLCARYRDSYRCDAYPDGIPFDVIASNEDHRQSLEGDHGLQFVPVTQVAAQYADDLFSELPIAPEAERPAKLRLVSTRRIPA